MNWLTVKEISLVLLILTIHCAFSIVIEVEKPKDLKKVIATKTNLFVFFMSNSKTSEVLNVKNVLKTVDGSVAFVDEKALQKGSLRGRSFRS